MNTLHFSLVKDDDFCESFIPVPADQQDQFLREACESLGL